MPNVQLNGTEIFYTQAGVGEIPCLVMHGGLGCDHTYMHPWMDALGDTFVLTYYDHRGNGRSGRPSTQTLNFAQFAADADALRVHLGAEQIAVMGSSYGGFIAQEYAIRYPDRVSLLVLMDTAPTFDYKDDVLFHARRKGATPEMLAALEALQPETDQEMADLMKLIGPLYYYNFDQALADAAMGKTIYCGSAAKRGFELLEGWTTLDRLGGVKAPTLVLVGRDDYITPPEQSERIQAAISDAELVVFEQSGHMPHLEEPEAFFAAIRGWVKRKAGQTEMVAGGRG